ncbi:hypothetical protein [Sphingomonas sp. SUN039]|uniref:hypothetical protein n=1 Tax=Sphingomonas sp. SUN039 TaxID=2937787 RepID=UPI002164648B|nr:hypothetical protein [Sphingomonas sp. SUN039]UVO55977.1 hypothetical protein M0209_01365 [Sphingomonas sp. SUN039]
MSRASNNCIDKVGLNAKGAHPSDRFEDEPLFIDGSNIVHSVSAFVQGAICVLLAGDLAVTIQILAPNFGKFTGDINFSKSTPVFRAWQSRKPAKLVL